MDVSLTFLFNQAVARNDLDEISSASDLKLSRATLRISAL
jgi:hypothetical protein